MSTYSYVRIARPLLILALICITAARPGHSCAGSRGRRLTPAATDYVLWSMTLDTAAQQHSLGGPLPDWVTVYHKIEFIYHPYNTWNDAGIVVCERDGQQVEYAVSCSAPSATAG